MEILEDMNLQQKKDLIDRCYPKGFAITLADRFSSILDRVYRAHLGGKKTIQEILEMPLEKEQPTYGPEDEEAEYGYYGYRQFFLGGSSGGLATPSPCHTPVSENRR